MTRITGFDTSAATERREGAEAHRREGERDLTGGLKRFHTAGENLQSGTGLGESRTGGEEGDRLRRFAESLKRADANPDGDDAALPDPRLLAVAEPGRPAAVVVSSLDGAAERRADALAQGERIARMVEGALRAELSPVPGRPLTLSFEALRPGEAAGAIAGVSLTLHEGMLDVTLRRNPDGTQDALFLQSAQALAERLGQRYPRRVVRVLEEAAGAVEREAAEGPSRPSVFDLFARRDERS
ncbi:hypothetical protein [Aureimonas sp. AU4]|uniref:hypothetical protein n=1 Tax=Aureimonas sp. AU4 TaxID=1638163 RepID=UPI000782DE02|nr:hypothetical protein [Aureimonas sp. AU4]